MTAAQLADISCSATGLDSLDRLDTEALASEGLAVIPGLLDAGACDGMKAMYGEASHFRSRIVMARHGFGSGEYQYFAYPLPTGLADLRARLYARLVATANSWNTAMGRPMRYPPAHQEFIARCHSAGQTRPTPLLLQYALGDYNCLHQDLYGELVFPLQVAVLLSRPDIDFAGGEFVLTEQRPRMQSRVQVVPLEQGDAVVFAVNERPRQGSRGLYKVRMRHGVSTVRAGNRHTLGIIFHDAA